MYYGIEARATAKFEVGNRVVLYGRLQSKEFEVKDMSKLNESKHIMICEIAVDKLERIEK